MKITGYKENELQVDGEIVLAIKRSGELVAILPGGHDVKSARQEYSERLQAIEREFGNASHARREMGEALQKLIPGIKLRGAYARRVPDEVSKYMSEIGKKGGKIGGKKSSGGGRKRIPDHKLTPAQKQRRKYYERQLAKENAK